MLGVVKLLALAKAVPPVATAYQTADPALLAASKVKLPASHRAAGVVEVIVGDTLAVANTAVRCELHVAVAAST